MPANQTRRQRAGHGCVTCESCGLSSYVRVLTCDQFQYMSMSRYALQVTRRWKESQAKQHAMEAAYSKERKQRRQIQAEVLDQKSRLDELEKLEAQLRKWEKRKPLINHYLGLVGEMAK